MLSSASMLSSIMAQNPWLGIVVVLLLLFEVTVVVVAMFLFVALQPRFSASHKTIIVSLNFNDFDWHQLNLNHFQTVLSSHLNLVLATFHSNYLVPI